MLTQKLSKPISTQKTKNESLFSGVWIRWGALNAAERLVCAIIVLMPIWWAMGIIPYIIYFLPPGITFYEWRRYGKLRLQRPSFVVIALFVFYMYGFVANFLLFFDAHPLAALPAGTLRRPQDLVEGVLSTFSLPYLIWYIQSKNVRVRLEVVAWALSVSVAQMLAVWFVVHFVFAESFYNPPRTLWGTLTGKTTDYTRGLGDTNYLLLYWPTDHGIGGLPRFYSFLHRPESLALFVGVAGVLALDISKRLWSVLLFVASIFLLGLSGTRTVWLAFPLVLLIRLLLTTSRGGGSRLFLTLLAIASFVTLSLSPVTDLVLNSYSNTAAVISEFREDSTEHRAAAYKGTLERILDNPPNFIFGHVVDGPIVAGTEIEIGSHSYILGSLLYKGGLVGTGLFMTFWLSLIVWLYDTRMGRPMSCLLILLLLTITFATMLLSHVSLMSIPLSMMLGRPVSKSLRRNAY